MQLDIKIISSLFKNISKNNDKTRDNLRSVAVWVKDQHVIYTATDGTMLAVIRGEHDSELTDNLEKIIIPEFICSALKPGKYGYQNMVILEYEQKESFTCKFSVPSTGQSFNFESFTNHYPDISMVIPRSISGEIRQYDAFKLAQLQTISGQKYQRISHNGNGPALITWKEIDGFGVIMPISDKSFISYADSLPDWI